VASQENMPNSENSVMPHVTVTVAEGDKRTSGDVCRLIALIEQEIAHGKVEDLPVFLGELERVKAILWSRMVSLSCNSRSNRLPDAVTLLTMPQVAKRLAIPEGRAYELARQERLPTVKIGKYVRVPLAELETWLSQQTSLERRIDRKRPGFHSALTASKRSGRALTGARTPSDVAQRKRNEPASFKSVPKTEKGFRQPAMTAHSSIEVVSVEAEMSHKEG
jgi:excisionase family DNA binding protein